MSQKKITDDDALEIEKESDESLKRQVPDKDDIAKEESFSSSGLVSPEPAIDKDETDPDKLREQLALMEDRFLRSVAEFENYKKRTSRQFDDSVQGAEADIFKQVLEIFDNFKRALELPENQKNFESFEAGMKLIYEQMKKFLERHKIESIESVGKKFDPSLHEAIMQIDSDEHPEGVVASEMAGGFKKGERVIRHAKVGVSKGKSKK